MLKELRETAEATAASKIEQIRQDVIYAAHVLKYGGDAFTGFGNGASSFYNHYPPIGFGSIRWTGIDELDNFVPDTKAIGYNSYAQVST